MARLPHGDAPPPALAPVASGLGAVPPGASAILAAEGVVQTFGAVRALRGVDVAIRPGEVVSLIGENGSGKSTLLSVLAGVRRPTAGRVLVDGEPRSYRSPQEALAAGVTLVPQEADLAEHLSVAENIWMGNLPSGPVRRGELERRAAAMLRETLDLELDVTRLASDLRPDEAMMVSMCRACARRPRVILLDETTASLGGEAVERFLSAVERLRERGLSVVMVSHRMDEHRRVADRLIVLRDGEVMAERTWGTTDERELVRLMVGRDLPDFIVKREAQRGAPLLEARNLRLGPDLEPFDLDVRAGEIVGIGGLAGAGRSRLARILAGAEPPSGGTVRVGGRELRAGSVADATTHGVGFVPEDRKAQGLLLGMSVRANVALGARRRLTRWGVVLRRAERALVDDLVHRLQIKTASLDTPVATLSGGNQQKVVMGRLLAAQTRVFVLDEPTKGIDVLAKSEMFGLIGDAVAAGGAVVLITSELPELLGLSDRIVVLRRGNMVAEIPRDRATEERVVEAAMGIGEGEERYAA